MNLEDAIVAAGGAITVSRDEDGTGLARVGALLLRFTWERLDVARAAAFDRWANSTIWSGPVPDDVETLRAVIDAAARGKDDS